MTNTEYYNNIKAGALSSCYWCREVIRYLKDPDTYAPIISDGVYKVFFDAYDDNDVKGIERRLGRRLLVEELNPAPSSVPYLLSGHPLITESNAERLRLQEFEQLINDRIRTQETRTRNTILKTL